MANPPKKEVSAKAARSRVGAMAVGAYVPVVARAAFEAHGFPSAAILTDWPDIIGAEFAAITAPERLVWPRRAERDELAETGGKSRSAFRRTGATLVVRVDGPRALEVQHMACQLVERVNVYFGYRAVSELRLLQGPVRRESPPQTQPPQPSGDETTLGAPIEDEGLRAALSRLGSRAKE